MEMTIHIWKVILIVMWSVNKMDDLELYQLLGLEEDYIKFQNEMKGSIELFKFITGDDE